MLKRAEKTSTFSLARARHIVADLFEPKPWIYWTDFLTTALIGNTCIATCLYAVRSWDQFLPSLPLAGRIAVLLVAYVICSLAFYRMSMFIHELVHLRSGTMLGFRAVWNLLCGIPFLMPSFVYYTHLDHHRRSRYGTDHDGEYLSFGIESPWSIIRHMLLNFVIPVLAMLRFLVLGPISWFVPPLRRWVLQHASSMVIDYAYVRPLPKTRREAWTIFIQELACFAFLGGLMIVYPLLSGRFPYPFLIVGYSVSTFILTLNAIRTLGSHRWSNPKHEEMTFVEQLLDSVNVHSRPWLAELWGPIGTRYHALHHLFPGLPYHSMPEAHRRLIEQLPPDSPYRQAEEPSLTAALVNLWQRSSAVAQSRDVSVSQAT